MLQEPLEGLAFQVRRNLEAIVPTTTFQNPRPFLRRYSSQESNHSLMSKVGNPIHRPGSTSTIRKPSGKSPGDGVDGNSAGAGLCFFAAMIFHPFIRVAGQVSRAMEDFPSTPARRLGGSYPPFPNLVRLYRAGPVFARQLHRGIISGSTGES